MNLINDDCIEAMKRMEIASVDSIVTDPPYHLISMVKRLSKTNKDDIDKNFTKIIPGQKTNPYETISRGFMGQTWDGGDIAFRPDVWVEAYRVLKPGGHLLAFGGTRTYHRMVCAIEDAGFEIRDQIGWVYGSGFPKSYNISKAIDKAAGVECDVIGSKKSVNSNNTNSMGIYNLEYNITNPTSSEAKQWEGWGTALKPAWEPIVVARKPLEGTVADNVLSYGTGAININDCRVNLDGNYKSKSNGRPSQTKLYDNYNSENANIPDTIGRWPANIIHDGSDEVLNYFPITKSVATKNNIDSYDGQSNVKFLRGQSNPNNQRSDSGSAARFFYSAKTSKSDREDGNDHPTVKPTDLMRYLCRLVTPPNGTVLDPFMGSGSTGKAALLEGFDFIGIEKEIKYFKIAQQRIKKNITQFFEE
jgi:DNA modification methylase